MYSHQYTVIWALKVKKQQKPISLHHGLCGYELDGEAFEAPQSGSPLAGLPGASLPSIAPPQTSKRGRPSSPYMSASESMPLAAWTLWYQNSPETLSLKKCPSRPWFRVWREGKERLRMERGETQGSRSITWREREMINVLASCVCSATAIGYGHTIWSWPANKY